MVNAELLAGREELFHHSHPIVALAGQTPGAIELRRVDRLVEFAQLLRLPDPEREALELGWPRRGYYCSGRALAEYPRDRQPVMAVNNLHCARCQRTVHDGHGAAWRVLLGLAEAHFGAVAGLNAFVKRGECSSLRENAIPRHVAEVVAGHADSFQSVLEVRRLFEMGRLEDCLAEASIVF